MKAQKQKRENRVGDQHTSDIGVTLEQLFDNVEEDIPTLLDQVGTAMKKEIKRFRHIASGEDAIKVDKVRVIISFLTAYCDELGALQTRVEQAHYKFISGLLKDGMNPIAPEVWSRSNTR
jgi:hypothetical protein